MRILALLPAALAAPLLVASCGLVHLPGSTDCATPDGGPPGCPCEPPSPGDPCHVDPSMGGPTCTYGTEQLPGCRQLFSCVKGEWQFVDPAIVGGCPASAECPATQPQDGTACARGVPLCGYPDDTLCSCNQAGWSCLTVLADSFCPASIPNAGTTCSKVAHCGYTTGCAFRAAECVDGVWVWLAGGC